MFASYQLGRTLGEAPSDAPKLSRSMKMRLAPARLDRSHVPFRPAMDHNDRIGNCTAVGVANSIRAQAALSGWQANIPTQRVIDLYSASAGYDPARPDTDRGAPEATVLAWQLANGFDTGTQTRYYGLWGSIDPQDLNHIRLTMAMLGGCYLGVALATADQTGDVWDTTTPGDHTPGSWGGHCLWAWDYTGTNDDDIVRLGTWGQFQPATWRWLRKYIEEGHGLTHPQMIGPTGKSPAGLDIDAMREECS